MVDDLVPVDPGATQTSCALVSDLELEAGGIGPRPNCQAGPAVAPCAASMKRKTSGSVPSTKANRAPSIAVASGACRSGGGAGSGAGGRPHAPRRRIRRAANSWASSRIWRSRAAGELGGLRGDRGSAPISTPGPVGRPDRLAVPLGDESSRSRASGLRGRDAAAARAEEVVDRRDGLRPALAGPEEDVRRRKDAAGRVRPTSGSTFGMEPERPARACRPAGASRASTSGRARRGRLGGPGLLVRRLVGRGAQAADRPGSPGQASRDDPLAVAHRRVAPGRVSQSIGRTKKGLRRVVGVRRRGCSQTSWPLW